jgi:glycosyltransferase involved in cell wall biosynthesis
VRVLVQIRSDRDERLGGDTLHAESSAAELRRLGVEVDVTGARAVDPSGYDVVHLYNTAFIRPTLRRALRARGCGVPVVLETIYWDMSHFQPPVVFRHEEGLRRVAFALAERAISNSRSESEAVAARFPDAAERLRVVPVGAFSRPELADGDAEAFCERFGLEPGFVLCVGRKELRKNQLRLIHACGSLGVALVLVGGEHPENEAYVAECRAAAAAVDVRFLPHLDGPEVAGAYAAAAVHAQPSLWETIGLASFDAALAGCRVVTTRRSGISEYLRGDAHYCDPWDEGSIAAAVAAALAAPPPEGLGKRLHAEFSWRRSAEETLVVYEEAMRAHEQRDGEPLLPPAQYAEHLEELVQLQLEAIAFRDESLDGFQAHTANLAAQVAQLEAWLDEARAQLEAFGADLGRSRAEASQAQAELARTRSELDATRAHLEQLHQTKLYRWSAPLRGVYARARRR